MIGDIIIKKNDTYKLNYRGKGKLRCYGLLPVYIQCDRVIIESSHEFLENISTI